jgi:uncharacterized membrane protein YgcG
VENNGLGRRGLAGLGLILWGLGLLLANASAIKEAPAAGRAGYRLINEAVAGLGRTAAIWLAVFLVALGYVCVACWKYVPRVAAIRGGFAAITATLFLVGGTLALDATFGSGVSQAAPGVHHKAICHKRQHRVRHRCSPTYPSKPTPAQHPAAAPTGGSGGASGGTGGGSGGASGGTGGGSGSLRERASSSRPSSP